jgi:MSHA pilin protein MshC
MGRDKRELRSSLFCSGAPARGFTLAELVAVISIAAVLAIIAVPRFWGSEFQQAQLYDQTVAALRFAQKSSLAMQRTVCVAFTGTTVTLTYDPNYAPTACTTALAGPTGGAYVVTAPSGTTLAAVPGSFNYNRLGQPSAAQTITVSGGRQMFVEAVSGYVRTP